MPKQITTADETLNRLRNVAASAITPFIGLFSGTPDASGNNGAEITTAGGYQRVAVTFGAPTESGTPGKRQIANSINATFPQATANWPAVSWFALFDNSTGGQVKYWGTLTNAPVTVLTGGIAFFTSGDLKVTEL